MRIVLATLHVRPSPQAVSLAAGSLAAALSPGERKDTVLLDLYPQMGAEAMLQAILEAQPELVAFPLYAWNRTECLDLSRRLRTLHPRPILLGGGPEATASPEGLLGEDSPLDGVIHGEGERPFAEVVRILARGEDPSGHPGLFWRSASGDVVQGKPLVPLAAEELPSPWLQKALTPAQDGGVLWEVSRGCAFGCDYCYDGRGGQGVRHLPWERLEAELELFVRSRVSQVWVLDSTFNFPPERGKKLLQLLRRKARHLHFHLEAKADFLDRETVRLLTRLNCSLQIGLQSIRPEVLKNIHRPFDPEQFQSRIHLLNAEGVTFGLDLIYGLPGDDYAGFAQSLEAALDARPNHIEMFPLAVLPGTPLYRNRARFGIRSQEHPPYQILSSDTLSSTELERCRQLAGAADLFYNGGRAVAYFHSLLQSTGMAAVEFLERFAAWALGPGGIEKERFLSPERWNPEDILSLQEQFITSFFQKNRKILPAALDLMRFHFHYAETLLTEEVPPARAEALRGKAFWETPLHLSPGVRLVSFAYEILDLQEMGECNLENFTAIFRPVGSVALFQRRGNQVLCESLEEDFLKLLQESKGDRTPQEIFSGSVSREEGEEIVEFALAEGFLLPEGSQTLISEAGS